MNMREKINKVRHIAILFITIIVFFLGVLIGGSIEELRVQSLYTQLQEQDLEYQSIVAEGNYIDYIVDLKGEGANISCDSIMGGYYTSIDNLDKSRIKLENYINTGSVQEIEFQRLKDHYANMQINYWILANKINNLCDNRMNPILYFYADDESCPACEDQGVYLNYVKQVLEHEVLVFSLDSGKGGPTQLLAQQYDVYYREKPILVIDEQTHDFSNNEEIFGYLCEAGLNHEVCS